MSKYFTNGLESFRVTNKTITNRFFLKDGSIKEVTNNYSIELFNYLMVKDMQECNYLKFITIA